MNKPKGIKTHWLESPNKNYLGHQDLPNGDDLILTINTAKWEEVVNPMTNVSSSKRVIRFKEKGIKPFICNETNAFAILSSTGKKFMEDCQGAKIKLKVASTKIVKEVETGKWKKVDVDCIRVALDTIEKELKKINELQLKDLENWLEKAKRSNEEFCEAMKINSLGELPEKKFLNVIKRLEALSHENL